MRDDGREIRNLAVVVMNHLGLFVEGLGETKRPHCRFQNKANSFEFTAMAVQFVIFGRKLSEMFISMPTVT
jgi:hypothetical protein